MNDHVEVGEGPGSSLSEDRIACRYATMRVNRTDGGTLPVLGVRAMTDDGRELLGLSAVGGKEDLDGGSGLIRTGASRLYASPLGDCRLRRELDRRQRCWHDGCCMLGIRTHLKDGGGCQRPCRHACACRQTTPRLQTAAAEPRASSPWIRSCEMACAVVKARARSGVAV
jgi:hypothetical protein